MKSSEINDFYERTRGSRKIMVVDLGFLGDTIHLVPALWEIKDHYPEAELHVLSTPVGCEVLKMVACVVRPWCFPLGPPSPKWWEHWDVLKELRRERFDLVYNFGGGDRSVFITRIIHPENAMAYQGARKHFWQPWLVPDWVTKRRLPTPVFESRREVLRLCGLKLQAARFDFTISAPDLLWAESAIPEGSIHLSLNASFALKEWPMRQNIEFVQALLQGGLGRKIIVSAAPNPREQARLMEFKKAVNDSRIVFIEDRMSIPRVAAMLKRCALHVGPDSGVIHLAYAVGIRTVSIFRRYHDMADWLPVGERHHYFDAPCQCINSDVRPCESRNEAQCLAGVSPQKLVQEVVRQIAVSTEGVD